MLPQRFAGSGRIAGDQLDRSPLSWTPLSKLYLYISFFAWFAALCANARSPFSRNRSLIFRDPICGSLSEEGAFALAGLALKNPRGALVNADVDPDAEQTAKVALGAIPRTWSLTEKIGIRHLTAVAPSSVARLNHFRVDSAVPRLDLA